MISYRFETGTGEQVQGWEPVVPILRIDEPLRVTCIGTGFFIHTGGILVTAAHVVRDVIDEDGKPTANLAVLQYVPPNQFVRRHVIKASWHTVEDVAVLGLQTLNHKETGAPLRNKVLRLTGRVAKAGDLVSTWAFPKSQHEYAGKSGSVSIRPKLYDGKVLEELSNRGGLLRGRCYATSLGIEGGASGGPVFDEHGHVFAINSTGFSGVEDLGFVSHIQSVGGLSVAKVMTTDGQLREQITIHSLIERGEVLVEHINRKPPQTTP
jgi:hypothetical protein